MLTQPCQIKVNLSPEIKALIDNRARTYGMPVSTYVKHLILKDVESTDVPTRQPSTYDAEANRAAVADFLKDF